VHDAYFTNEHMMTNENTVFSISNLDMLMNKSSV